MRGARDPPSPHSACPRSPGYRCAGAGQSLSRPARVGKETRKMHREANSSQPFSTGRRGEKGITLVIYCYVTNYVKLSGSRQQVCMTPSLCGPGLWAGLTRLVWAPGLPWPRPASYRGLGHLKSGRGWRGCPRGPHRAVAGAPSSSVLLGGPGAPYRGRTLFSQEGPGLAQVDGCSRGAGGVQGRHSASRTASPRPGSLASTLFCPFGAGT